ncbi:MAG: DedA family protein [Solirubrobacteraceae bacterium]|nr:DedA family protein [Solirubrobacteraceae bacterium]
MPTVSFLVLAAITDRLADWATTVVGDLGLPGIFVLMTLESACIPIPSEPTMLFAGFNVDQGTYSFAAAVSVAVAANVVGSWIAYGVGRFGRYELIQEHGKWLHITPARLEQAERWFEKYGGAAVFFSRMLPIVRTFISLPAGVAKMPFGRFTLYTFLGCIPWMAGLVFLGMTVDKNWEKWRDKLHYIDYLVIAAIVIGAVWLFIRWRRNRGKPTDAQAA